MLFILTKSGNLDEETENECQIWTFPGGKDKEFSEMKILEDGSSDQPNTQDGSWFGRQW